MKRVINETTIKFRKNLLILFGDSAKVTKSISNELKKLFRLTKSSLAAD